MTGAEYPGKFITLEGGEGAGKSTQAARLGDRLRAAGHDVVVTREPGGAPGADAIRALLVSGDTGRWDPVSEALLHFAARRAHLVETVWPALQAGQWVVSDRFADSTIAYQGYGHGVPREQLDALYAMAVGDFRPDLTLILDIPVADGLERAGTRNSDTASGEDRYERMGAEFHERLREGFLAIANAEPQRCAVIDANADIDVIADAIWQAVSTRLSTGGRA